MKEWLLLLSISGLCGSMALAEPLQKASDLSEAPTENPVAVEEVEPPALAETIREHDAARKKLEQQNAEARTALRDWYASSIEALRKEAISAGDLDRVISIDTERQNVDTDISPEEKAKLFYALRELRGRYDRQRAEQARQATADVRSGLLRYGIALDRVASTLSRNGDVAAARVVEKARLSMLGAPPTTACATASPSVSTLTSTVLALRSTAIANSKNQDETPTAPGTTKSLATVPPATTANVPGSNWGKSSTNATLPGSSTGWATAAVDPSKNVAVPSETKPASAKAPPQTMGKGAQGVAKVITPRSSGSGAAAGRTWGTSAPAGGGAVGGGAWGASGPGFR